jgi:hypothetical protein
MAAAVALSGTKKTAAQKSVYGKPKDGSVQSVIKNFLRFTDSWWISYVVVPARAWLLFKSQPLGAFIPTG